MVVPFEVHDATPLNLTRVRYQVHLRNALSRHAIVIFPRYGCLDPEDQLRIGSIFGPLQDSLPDVDEPCETNRLVQVIERNASGGIPELRRPSSFYWHTDRSFLPDPAAVTLLNMWHPAESGGETEFLSLRDGFQHLPLNEQESLRHTSLCHSYSHYHRSLQSQNITQDKQEMASKLYEDVWHPLVVKDPISGVEAIYYSELCATALQSTDSNEFEIPSLGWVKEKVISHGKRYIHRWEQGDLVVWNNFAVTHRSSPSKGYRHLRRVVVASSVAIDGC